MNEQEIVRVGRRVTWVGFWVNAALAAVKIVAGIVGRSGALVADGVHSLSDFATDVVVIVMLGVSRRSENSRYTYGHGKYETLGTLIIAVLLVGVGLALFYGGLEGVIKAARGEMPPRPTWLALIVAVLSIASKEWLFHYTRRWGERIGSSAVIANAWHHRSDAISSVATLAGVAGAMFLGHHWTVLDPIAAMLVSVFIVGVGVKLAIPSVKELLEVSLPESEVAAMKRIVKDTPGVIAFHHFRSRQNGDRKIVDIHLKVDPGITVSAAHDIATNVEERLRDHFGNVLANTHIEPYRGETRCTDGGVKD